MVNRFSDFEAIEAIGHRPPISECIQVATTIVQRALSSAKKPEASTLLRTRKPRA